MWLTLTSRSAAATAAIELVESRLPAELGSRIATFREEPICQ
ncbi:hypothetical protein SCE1572_13905 [Sorangium cellulosum So0157-2]|uniref:Uncharacterized protein n=1 Tax=Sorangium cellulosum So0157-2 TaxID=1254432 RepID=S4XY52_SORCE|nr:hypothetical protein SCE1572_13905 [Sorangium cellulosum So0157-2]